MIGFTKNPQSLVVVSLKISYKVFTQFIYIVFDKVRVCVILNILLEIQKLLRITRVSDSKKED
jgi:hypothetical protein